MLRVKLAKTCLRASVISNNFPGYLVERERGWKERGAEGEWKEGQGHRATFEPMPQVPCYIRHYKTNIMELLKYLVGK